MSQILPLIRRIAENTKARAGDGRMEKFFLFNFAAKSFAIPAVDVTEIVLPGSLISIPEQSDFISGVVNIRGTIVPVINIRERLNLEKEFELNDDSRLIIFTLKTGCYVAMLADSIECRLKDGVMTALAPALEESEEKVFRSALIEDAKHHVLLIDHWLSHNEIKILQNVVESF